jgi:hypothetical protein
MKKIICTILALTSFAVSATEFCNVTDKRGFHPDGTPLIRVKVSCSDVRLQNEILNKYDHFRIGQTDYFLKQAKKEIINDIKLAGYTEVKSGFFQLLD